MFTIRTSFASLTLVLTVALADTKTSNTGTVCTRNNRNGTCIPFNECRAAVQLFELHDVQALRSLFCGYEAVTPLVCCSNRKPTNRVTTSRPTTRRPTNGSSLSTNRTTTRRPHTNPPGLDVLSTVTETVVNATTSSPDTATQEDSRIDHGISINEVIAEEEEERRNRSSTVTPGNQPTGPALLPNRKTCGTKLLIEDRIYGGERAEIDEFPWIAQIMLVRNDDKVTFMCSGTLISDRYVVTAAHCVKLKEESALASFKTIVRLSEWDMETDVDCYEDRCNEGSVDVGVEEKTVHPDYDAEHHLTRADIALLRLELRVNFTDFIRPICLPTTGYVANQDYIPQMSYVTAGWGNTEHSRLAPVLQKVEIRAAAMDVCRVAHSELAIYENSSICAGGRRGEDSCKGDSGGPLIRTVMENDVTNTYLFGITSYGKMECGQEGVPSLYTRIVPFMRWILSTLRP